ncbi:CocE/NonD family hydrolase [Curtobacterium ammoniigenes]|uniref:CocE/NonD family hydrolase n=1 Tax=Curtobacterium ammoniigenes TaxID=395387 RepID=UPI0009FA469A|nr:CocE/NonD family hydrolase [Curtobacterium ammoniigenes]
MSVPPIRGLMRRVQTAIRPRVHVTPAPNDVNVAWNVPVRLRDGVTLRMNVFRPQTDEPVPVIMSAHPYNKDAIPAATRSGRGLNFQFRLFPQPDPITISEWTSWEAPDPVVWVRRGYAVVNADLRGGGRAEGSSSLFSDEEAADYAELIRWAGTQPWSNGRVGLLGVSYLAISQYKVAALRPPHLAAICPWEGFTDIYRDFLRPGGIREDGFAIIWSALSRRLARVNDDLRQEQVHRVTRDQWYEERTPDLGAIRVPMLVCGSFSDHNLHTRGSFEAFRRAGSEQKWLVTHRDGKWSTFTSADAQRTQAAFFDHFLRGIDNGWEARSPVRIRVTDAHRKPAAIYDRADWPPEDATERRLHLDVTTGLLVDRPVTAPGRRIWRTHGPGLQFRWVVDSTLDVVGSAWLRLWVEAIDTTDVSLFVAMRKLRDGREITFEGSFGYSGDPITAGWQRAGFHKLDTDLSTSTQPVHTYRTLQPLVPGTPIPVDVALLPHATRLRSGDVIELDIRGTWPQPRNPVTGQFPSGYEPSPSGSIALHSGGEHGSSLLFTTMRCGDSQQASVGL